MLENNELQSFKSVGDMSHYFAKFNKVLTALQQHLIPDSGNMLSPDLELQNNDVMLHLFHLKNTMALIGKKYAYSLDVKNKYPAELQIDTTDSGFPFFNVMVEVEVDKEKALRKLDEMPKIEKLRSDLLDHVIAYRRIPRDIQYAISQYYYLSELLKEHIFKKQNTVTASHNRDGSVTHSWAQYDSKTNRPVIYLMRSTTTNDESPSLIELNNYIQNVSNSESTLYGIAKSIDEEFKYLHPKMLKRIHVGPFYANGMTKHNELIQNLLDGVSEEDNWICSWRVETLVSGGEHSIKKGVFGSQVLQLFKVDREDPLTDVVGATEVDQILIVPYSVYQKMNDKFSDTEQLRYYTKYVLNKDGTIMENA